MTPCPKPLLLLTVLLAAPVGAQSTAPVTSLDVLYTQLCDNHPNWVDRALKRVGPSAAPLIPRLMALFDERPVVAQVALSAIGAAAVPHLIERLRWESDAERVHVLATLRDLGPLARPALPELIALARRPQPGLLDRSYALDALVATKDPRVPVVLESLLDDLDSTVVLFALQALDTSSETARVQRWLRRTLDPAGPSERRALAAGIAAQAGHHELPVRDALLAAIHTEPREFETRYAVHAGLRHLGSEGHASWASPVLLDAITRCFCSDPRLLRTWRATEGRVSATLNTQRTLTRWLNERPCARECVLEQMLEFRYVWYWPGVTAAFDAMARDPARDPETRARAARLLRTAVWLQLDWGLRSWLYRQLQRCRVRWPFSRY